jgi:hypothetical protein
VSSSSDDEMDDVYDLPASSERQAATNEWLQYCSIVKKHNKFPTFKKKGLIDLGKVQVGIVEERGRDIEASHPFRKCNLADFIDKTGYFDLVKFLAFNKQSFPYLHKLACCIASMRTNEVGCEQFFSIAGYVSNPRRASLKVKHYECMAMLKHNLQQVYVDEDWVAKEYLSTEKNKGWDESETKNDELVDKLEKELLAEDLGVDMEMTGADEQEVVEVEDSDETDDDETAGST